LGQNALWLQNLVGFCSLRFSKQAAQRIGKGRLGDELTDFPGHFVEPLQVSEHRMARVPQLLGQLAGRESGETLIDQVTNRGGQTAVFGKADGLVVPNPLWVAEIPSRIERIDRRGFARTLRWYV